MRIHFWLACLGSVLVGCGSGASKPVKVEGTLTLDGKPLTGVVVQFVPDDPQGHMAMGTTGTNGEFRLTTFNSGDGAPPGMYKIVVLKPEVFDSGGPPGDTNDPKFMMEMMKKYRDKSRPGAAGASKKKGPIPENYTKSATTPLKQQVPTDGPVKIDLRSSGS